MAVNPFSKRLATVRDRFIANLESKIQDSYLILPRASCEQRQAIEAVEEIYLRIHSIVGIGPTVGFSGTGRAARSVETALMPAYSAKRGLTVAETDLLKKAMHALRETARHELQTTYSSWR